MAPLAVIIGAGIGLQALGQIQAGQAAAGEAESMKAMAEYNARLQEQEARAAEAQAEWRQKRQAEEAARYRSTLRAGMGAAGVSTTEGSPLMVEAAQAAQDELENLMIGYEGQIGASRARSQAAIDRAQGTIYGQRARNARTAGFMGAGTTLLTGFANQWS